MCKQNVWNSRRFACSMSSQHYCFWLWCSTRYVKFTNHQLPHVQLTGWAHWLTVLRPAPLPGADLPLEHLKLITPSSPPPSWCSLSLVSSVACPVCSGHLEAPSMVYLSVHSQLDADSLLSRASLRTAWGWLFWVFVRGCDQDFCAPKQMGLLACSCCWEGLLVQIRCVKKLRGVARNENLREGLTTGSSCTCFLWWGGCHPRLRGTWQSLDFMIFVFSPNPEDVLFR